MVGEGGAGWVEADRRSCLATEREVHLGGGRVEVRELGWRKDRCTFYIGGYSVNIFMGARIMNCGENLPDFHRLVGEMSR